MLLNTQPVTVEQFEQFIARSENAERRFELINGEIVEKMPTQLHALISALFIALLHTYRQKNPIIRIFSEIRVKLPGDESNDLIPDVAAMLKEGRRIDPDAPLSQMPDLVIEVQSPSQTPKFMSDKAAYYLSHGARMVWVVYTKKRIVEVLTNDSRELLTEEDNLTGGDLLPGFSVAVKDIYQDLDE